MNRQSIAGPLLEWMKEQEAINKENHARHMELAELTCRLAELVGDLERRLVRLEEERVNERIRTDS